MPYRKLYEALSSHRGSVHLQLRALSFISFHRSPEVRILFDVSECIIILEPTGGALSLSEFVRHDPSHPASCSR